MSKFSMAGTEGTGEYTVYVVTALGRLGVRLLSDGRCRIRLEPSGAGAAVKMSASLTREAGWKQPGDQDQLRFSTVVDSEDALRDRVTAACAALGVDATSEFGPECPDGLKALFAPPAEVLTETNPEVLRKEAEKLAKAAERSRVAAEKKLAEANARAKAAAVRVSRAQNIDEAVAGFDQAKGRLTSLGLPVPNGNGKGNALGKLSKASLAKIAKDAGVAVPKGATKEAILAALAN